jgi:arylsulfatase A-like enzyme
VDALRRDHVGAYGYDRPTTPFIDHLANIGVTFDNAYAQAPQTLHSTATMFTSRYFPFILRGVEHDPIPGFDEERQRRWARTPRLARANITFAEVLREAGYQTFGLFTNPHHHATSGFWQGFEDARYLTTEPGYPYGRVETVCREFQGWLASRISERPFFAYLHLMDVHNPYRPPAPQRSLFPPGEGRYVFVKGRPQQPLDPADLDATRALYDGEIRYVDDSIRDALTQLLRDGALDNTVVLITSDHGEEFMDHGGLGHGTGVEPELLRIPLIVAGSTIVESGGRRFRPLVRNLDIAPTLVELAQQPVPAVFEGTSLVPVLRGTASSSDYWLLSYARVDAWRSLTSRRWHVMWDRTNGAKRLYDMSVDPRGMHDVASQHPHIVTRVMSRLRRLEERRRESDRRAQVLRSVEIEAPITPEDIEILRQLEALGYLDDGG